MMNIELRPYERYKKSEAEYISQYPDTWETVKLRVVLEERKEKNRLRQTTNILSVMKGKGVIPYSEKGNVGNKCSEDIERYNVVHPDDIVMNCMNVIIGSVGRSKYHGALSQVYYVLKNRDDLKYNIKYYENVFRMTSLQKELTKYGKGILAHRMRVPMEMIKNIELPLPPKSEQDQIVKYLDRQMFKINKLVRNKKKVIALLKEQRKIIINEAVTKGLCQNVKMKPSGFDYIESIPEGWVISKIGYVGNLQNGISESGSFFTKGTPFVSYGDVYNNDQLPISVSGVANSSQKQQQVYSVKRGDIFFTRTSETIEEIGLSSVCLNDIENAVFSGFLIRFRPNNEVLDPIFSKYYFKNDVVRNFFVKEMNIVIRASLGQNLLRNVPLILPPLSEQREIGHFLDIKTAEIDKVIEKAQCEISLITEYLESLLSDVVTGKVDVRNIVIDDAEEEILEDIEIDEDSTDDESLEVEDGDE
jgi:type I restriction enzyme S subunit